MKLYELSDQEIKDLLVVLNYYIINLHSDDSEVFDRAKALFNRIAPKIVTKEGWMVIYSNGINSGVYDSEFQARQDGLRTKGSQVVKVTWEQEE